MEKKKRLVIVGGHGSGEIAMSVFTELFSDTPDWKIIGYVNDLVESGQTYGGFNVVSSTANLGQLCQEPDLYIHYTLHFHAKLKRQRVSQLLALKLPLDKHISGVHPKAFLNPTSSIGVGSLMLPSAATSANSRIGNFVHMYTNCFIGHDSIVHDFATIAAHAVVGARVHVEEGAHVGLNATVREDCRIGPYSIVGMGAVVTKDVPENSIVAGNPARIIGETLA